jgi:hypothetical protein
MARPRIFVSYSSVGQPNKLTGKEKLGHLRDYLFGAGSVIDPLPLCGSNRRIFRSDDRDALLSDWQEVGNDMRLTLWSLDHTQPVAGRSTNDKTSAQIAGDKPTHHSGKRRHVTAS